MIAEKLAAALQLHRAGRWQEAAQGYEEIVATDPNQPDAWHLLGMALHALGDDASARLHLLRAIAISPDFADYHNNLSTICYALGDFAATEAHCREALRLRRAFPQAYNNLGNALLAQGLARQALAAYDEAARLDPRYARALANAASAWRTLGEDEASIAACRRALELDPACYEATHHLCIALRKLGRFEPLEQAVRAALIWHPADARLHCDLGELLWRKQDAAAAQSCFLRALELQPDLAIAHFNLANTFRELGRSDESLGSYRQALACDPRLAPAMTNLAISLSDQGRVDEALTWFERAYAETPGDALAGSHLLVCRQYQSGHTAAHLAAYHREWNRRHAACESPEEHHEPMRTRASSRPLRIGFVSRDFRRHPVGFFLLGLLDARDRRRLVVHSYSDHLERDERTERIQAASDRWLQVHGLTDQELARQIASDDLDLCVDLAGHTANHRLLVFARRPAPRLATWMGYVGTTGLSAIDYLISDRFHTPVGCESDYCERIVRLPGSYVCYVPPEDAPPVSPLPAERLGRVTFGSLNNPAKISNEAVRLWAQIMRRLPASRLLLKYHGLDSHGAREQLLRRFQVAGIEPGRLLLEGASPHREFLARYGAVDLTLDTLPYSGGLSSCESLWMGVPVVTCPGETFASRHAMSHLTNIGLQETIAGSTDEYVELAVAWAEDVKRLAACRARLRDQMRQSTLCDSRTFANQWTAAVECLCGR